MLSLAILIISGKQGLPGTVIRRRPRPQLVSGELGYSRGTGSVLGRDE